MYPLSLIGVIGVIALNVFQNTFKRKITIHLLMRPIICSAVLYLRFSNQPVTADVHKVELIHDKPVLFLSNSLKYVFSADVMAHMPLKCVLELVRVLAYCRITHIQRMLCYELL